MLLREIRDWDDAYSNGPNIPRGESWPQAWVGPSTTFRERLLAEGRAQLDIAYGDKPRNRFDLFMPEGRPRGLVVFVHGGFWLRLDKSYWSHLAAGPLAHGYAVAVPGYTLCPEIPIAGITAEIGAAITEAAALVAGPIRLVGHSAGGQLVTRMVSETSPLSESVWSRIAFTVSLSGLHDLRPLLATAMNSTLKLNPAMAAAESPALLAPLPGTRLLCWGGASERAEFVRQNALLANIWAGLGAATGAIEEADRHHFNVVDGLIDPGHSLTRALIET